MADRDVTIDVIARDKTGPAITSTERNLKRAASTASSFGSQLQRGVQQWERGFSRAASAASRWANSGDSSGKKFVRGITNGLGKLADLGGSIGSGISKSVNAAGPQVALAMVGILSAAAIAAAPAIGGAIVGGAGLGGIVGGVLIASKDARVASAFDSLKEEVGSDLQDAAKRFVPATLEAVKEAKAAFRGMLPDLRQLFDVSATWVAPLTRSLGRAAQLVVEGVTQAVTKAGPIIDAIGDGVEGVGKAVGQTFKMLSDNGASMGLALKGVFWLLEASIRGVGTVLNVLVEAFEFFVNKIPGGKKLLDSMTRSQDGARGSALNLAGGFQALADDATTAADGITRAKQKADEFADSSLSLREAQIAARDAVANATRTIRENGEAKGFNTTKGRENERALNDLARAFNAETDAGDRSGRSAREAAAAYATNREKLIAMAEKAGYSRQKAQELAAQLLKVPKNVNTDINIDTKRPAKNVETIKKAIKGVKGKTVTIEVQMLSNGNIRMPGGGQLTFADYQSWAPADGGMTSRTGGPRRPEPVSVTSNVRVDLNGKPFFDYVDRSIAESERRMAWRQKVGAR